MSVAAISVRCLYKRYADVSAIAGIDLSVEPGEFFGLLGPNGAGKSTLINIIAGLTRPTSGSVSVSGFDVWRDYYHARRAIGIVPQEVVFDPFFTVREVLRIQAGYFGCGKEVEPWIDELLAELKLSDKASANMRTLSGGMKRRVMIAQALVHKPPIVMLAEPTAGVDVELRKLLWSFVRRLHAQGSTIILTTHYLEEAEDLCERIAILNHGGIVALDKKEVLLARGIGNTLKVLVKTSEPVFPTSQMLAKKVKKAEGNVLEFKLDKNTDSIIQILDALRKEGAVIEDFHTEHADLEDVFMELTRAERE